MATWISSPLRFWGGVALCGIVGLLGSVLLHDAATKVERILDDRRPVTDWMIVHDLRVPDHVVGENPHVVFHRTVSRTLFGDWRVEAHDALGVQYCSTDPHGGSAIYAPSEKTRVLINFKPYTGGCELSAGRYRLTVVIRLSADRASLQKTISFQSNWFTILPTG